MLFLRDGFETTSIADIEQAAGIPEGAFFAAFPSKAAAVFAEEEANTQRLIDGLGARPAGESLCDGFAAVLAELADLSPAARERALLAALLSAESAEVRSHHAAARVRWLEIIAAWAAPRLSERASTRDAVEFAAIAMDCVEAGMQRWVEAGATLDLAGVITRELAQRAAALELIDC